MKMSKFKAGDRVRLIQRKETNASGFPKGDKELFKKVLTIREEYSVVRGVYCVQDENDRYCGYFDEDELAFAFEAVQTVDVITTPREGLDSTGNVCTNGIDYYDRSEIMKEPFRNKINEIENRINGLNSDGEIIGFNKNNKKTFMENLVNKFKTITRKEPARSLIEQGVMHEDGSLTQGGFALFVQYMFEKNQTEFYNDVVKVIADESKKNK